MFMLLDPGTDLPIYIEYCLLSKSGPRTRKLVSVFNSEQASESAYVRPWTEVFYMYTRPQLKSGSFERPLACSPRCYPCHVCYCV